MRFPIEGASGFHGYVERNDAAVPVDAMYELAKVRALLIRIQWGKYGLCPSCGRDSSQRHEKQCELYARGPGLELQ